MSSLQFNLDPAQRMAEAIRAMPANLPANLPTGAEAVSREARAASAFERSPIPSSRVSRLEEHIPIPRAPKIKPMNGNYTSIPTLSLGESSRANFRALPFSVSFRRFEPFRDPNSAIPELPLKKKSLTFREILQYQQSIGLEDPVEALRLYVRKNGASNFMHLDLSNSDIDDALLHRIAAELPDLTSLNLSHCSRITQYGLRALATQCHRLTLLDLSSNYRAATDAGLKTLADGCPKLATLNLSRCVRVTEGGVKALAAGCPDLTHLKISPSVWLTEDGRRAVLATRPGLNIIVK